MDLKGRFTWQRQVHREAHGGGYGVFHKLSFHPACLAPVESSAGIIANKSLTSQLTYSVFIASLLSTAASRPTRPTWDPLLAYSILLEALGCARREALDNSAIDFSRRHT